MKSYYQILKDSDIHIKLERYYLNYQKWEKAMSVLAKAMNLKVNQFVFEERLTLRNLSLEEIERFRSQLFADTLHFQINAFYSKSYLELMKDYNVGLDNVRASMPLNLLKPTYGFRCTYVECMRSQGEWFLMIESTKTPDYKVEMDLIEEKRYQEKKIRNEFVW